MQLRAVVIGTLLLSLGTPALAKTPAKTKSKPAAPAAPPKCIIPKLGAPPTAHCEGEPARAIIANESGLDVSDSKAAISPADWARLAKAKIGGRPITFAFFLATQGTRHNKSAFSWNWASAKKLPDLYRGARVLLLPSLYEGFGLTALEAMACGTPVLTSTVSSMPEVVGDAALLVDPLDTTAIARALERLMTDDALVEDLRARGLARAKLFSWETTGRAVQKAIREAVE